MIQAGGIFMASKVKKKQNLQGLTEQSRGTSYITKTYYKIAE